LIFNNKYIRPALKIYFSQFIVVLLGFFTNTILANNLGSNIFGQLSWILAIAALFFLVFNFGFPSVISVLLAEQRKKGKELKKILGSIFIICIIYIIFSSILNYISIELLKTIFQDFKILNIAFLIFIFLWPLKDLQNQIAKGSGNINSIIFSRSAYTIIIFFIVYILFRFDNLNISNIINTFSLTLVFTFLITALIIGFKLNLYNHHIKMIINKNKFYGSKMYFSSISASSWPEIMFIIIPFYLSLEDLSYYRLSLLMVSPMVLIGQNSAQIIFSSSYGKKTINFSMFRLNFIILLLSIILFNIFLESIISFFFNEEYLQIIPIARIMSIGAFFSGNYQMFDAYMNANSHGNEILLSCLIMTVSTLILMPLLIPMMGIYGSAIIYLVGNISYFISIYFFYKKVLKLS